jgi:hypothetical protein
MSPHPEQASTNDSTQAAAWRLIMSWDFPAGDCADPAPYQGRIVRGVAEDLGPPTMVPSVVAALAAASQRRWPALG